MFVHLRVGRDGRVVLPANLRRRMGVKPGDLLIAEERPHGLIVRTVAQSVARAQAIVRRSTADKPESSVDAFLAQRRADSGE